MVNGSTKEILGAVVVKSVAWIAIKIHLENGRIAKLYCK